MKCDAELAAGLLVLLHLDAEGPQLVVIQETYYQCDIGLSFEAFYVWIYVPVMALAIPTFSQFFARATCQAELVEHLGRLFDLLLLHCNWYMNCSMCKVGIFFSEKPRDVGGGAADRWLRSFEILLLLFTLSGRFGNSLFKWSKHKCCCLWNYIKIRIYKKISEELEKRKPTEGVEPSTFRLQGGCSATKLWRLNRNLSLASFL